MTTRQKVPVAQSGQQCPVCGMAVRLHYNKAGHADRYEYLYDLEFAEDLDPVDDMTAEILRKKRDGKRTVALVGMSPTSCSLAPYNEEIVDIWGLNEMHAFKWMKRATGWFQIHEDKYFRRLKAKREVYGHYDWLKREHGFPIYMQHTYDEIPDSVEYPLHAILEKFLGNIRRGEDTLQYFTSTFAFMIALSLYLDYDRIEIYGFDMMSDNELEKQRACGEFWIGIALGIGKEIYLPKNNAMLIGKLYGYEGIGHLIDDEEFL